MLKTHSMDTKFFEGLKHQCHANKVLNALRRHHKPNSLTLLCQIMVFISVVRIYSKWRCHYLVYTYYTCFTHASQCPL